MLEEHRPEVERVFDESNHAAGLVVLPERRLDDGTGVYENGLIDLVKDLRADGIEVIWADAPGQRAFIEKRSAAEVIWGAVLGIPGSLVSNAMWVALARWFRASPRSTGQVRVDIVGEVIHPDGTTAREWSHYEGTGAEVAIAIEANAPKAPPSEPSGE